MPAKAASKGERAGGVLPVSGAARAASTKQTAARLKLEIRRLPPSLTLSEFEEAIGEAWKLGNGKVDWREYRQGKVKSPGKLPEQSRCYVHLTSEALVKEFEQRFLAVVFHDKAGTHKNSDLRSLPPTLGYAPNQRVPLLNKQRVDNRQGTIDQDPEFIAFLEAETHPITKSAALDSSLDRDEPKVEVKSTPLIDDLREKKANRAKAAATKAEKKGHKRGESKEPTPNAKESGKGKERADTKKTEHATKDAAKAVSKQSGKASQSGTPAVTPQVLASPAKKKRERAQPSSKQATVSPAVSAPTSPAPQRATPAQRPRRDAEGIKKMLQKDLGIKPNESGTSTRSSRTRDGAVGTASQGASASQPSQQTNRAVSKPTTGAAVGDTAPLSTAPGTAEATSTQRATLKAFLKHANPSQGMTEELIKQALLQFGNVTSVTIDPRKGTAIAVFTSLDALQKAIQARKVSVANGAVEILEFKDRGGGGASSRGVLRGAARGNRGRAVTTPTTSTATTANASQGAPA